MTAVRKLGVPDGPTDLETLRRDLPPGWEIAALPELALLPHLAFGRIDAVLLDRPVSKDERVPFAKLLGAPPRSAALRPAPQPVVLGADASWPVLGAEHLLGIFSEEAPPAAITDRRQLPGGSAGPLRPLITPAARGFWRADPWAGTLAPAVRVLEDPAEIVRALAADASAIALLLPREVPALPAPVRRLATIGRPSPWDTALISRPGEDAGLDALRRALDPRTNG